MPALSAEPEVALLEPLPYADFVATMRSAECILTDSGGIQEEAPALGVPVVVAREATERPEAAAAGSSVVAGLDEDRIFETVLRIHRDPTVGDAMRVKRHLYGDGEAGVRVAEDVRRFLLSREQGSHDEAR
jgi:UDP-N-acetylglucosamine 2-epimerase (non-hydrolysing)